MASTIRNMSKSLPPSRTAPQFVVRFPDEELRSRIKQEAEANNRSMNAEIVFALQSFYENLDRERWESSPEYLEEIERAAREDEGPTEPGKSLNEHLAIKRAEKEADLVADKVAKLIDLDKIHAVVEFAMRALEQQGQTFGDTKIPSRTPTIPGQNAPKGGSKAPKKKGV